MEYIVTILISYLMGSIPFGFILTKFFLKKDIREIGSGNIGATNVLRSGNKVIGYTTLVLDVVKALIPVIYVKINFPELIFIASLCAFLGHVFPVWLKFKGGKGVATYVGILFSINIVLIFKYSSLSSIIGALSIPIYLFVIGQTNSVIFFTIMFVLIFFTHRENIKRLKNKEETRTKIY